MSMMENDDLPDGAVAYRAYKLALPDGESVDIAITLGQMDVESVPANFARKHDALAYGLVSLLDMPCAPSYPLMWMYAGSRLSIVTTEDDVEPDATLLALISRCLGLFIAGLAPISPQVAALQFHVAKAANDNTLH
jgi:hypothetical protein